MREIEFNVDYAKPFFSQAELDALEPAVALAHRQLHEGTGLGSDFLGWLDLPENYDRAELTRIKKAARKIGDESEILIVIGVGGSYLGARAGLEMLLPSFANLRSGGNGAPAVFFAGNNLSADSLQDLADLVAERDFSVNVISKSGTTVEPALAFRFFRRLLEKKYGRNEANRRIYATTDQSRGALKALADQNGYESFVIPADVGGRYSVLTAVGLLPLAAAGLDVEEIMAGAARARQEYGNPVLAENAAYRYAALRNIFYRKQKVIEIFAAYEPSLLYLGEWWKQLFGESEGKEKKGIFPASVNFTADLHSLGQLMQEGVRNIFTTTLWVRKPRRDHVLPAAENDLDGLNYLAGKTLSYVNEQALRGVLAAHTEGGLPNLVLSIPASTPYYFGALVYFFEKACALSGYLLGVNPFDQPGVEFYKKNMLSLLEKPDS